MSKTILITGASTGFGHLSAVRLAEQGHRVFASMRSPTTKNSSHAKTLESYGVNVIELDVRCNQSIQAAVELVLQKSGRLDVLVNNAGIAAAGVSEAFSDDQLKELFDINVFGVQRMMRSALPAMRKQKSGLIINVGSILGRVTFPFFGLYGASKFALEALTESYRYELSQLGIECVLIQPSAFPTSMYSSAKQPNDMNRVAQYGEIGAIPEAMFAQFMAAFESSGAPDPTDVAVGIRELVAMPQGMRPDRVTIGADYGSKSINEFTATVQRGVIEQLGLELLCK